MNKVISVIIEDSTKYRYIQDLAHYNRCSIGELLRNLVFNTPPETLVRGCRSISQIYAERAERKRRGRAKTTDKVYLAYPHLKGKK